MEKATTRTNLLYCGNRLIYKGIFLSALSAMMRGKGPFTVYVFTMEVDDLGEKGKKIEEKDILSLQTAAKGLNEANEIRLVDITPYYEKTLRHSKNHDNFYTPFTLMRLFFFEAVEEELDNLVYLDADTLVTGDVALGYREFDFNGLELGAVLDYLGQWWIGAHYFNAGVLYLNPPEIKKTRLFERAIALLEEKKLPYPDQTALNRLVEHWIELPTKYNDQRHIKEDTVIAHFPKHVYRFWDPLKPWDLERMKKGGKLALTKDIYERYLALFPFEDFSLKRPESSLLDN